jgi:hypothetical protein
VAAQQGLSGNYFSNRAGANSMRERDWVVMTETFEGHHEATKALVLAVAGLIAITLIDYLVLNAAVI